MSRQKKTPLIECNCEMRDTWARIHPQLCRLWNNEAYRKGDMDWDPEKQALVDVWEEFDTSTLATTTVPACKCTPEKKWLCIPCGVKRDEEWHQWKWDTGKKTSYLVKDRHAMTPLVFPNGITVYGSSMNRVNDELVPDFGIYLASGWQPQCLGFVINWTDFGLPKISWEQVVHAAQEAYKLAESGWKVEVGCIGGHGRTGTLLACIAVLSGVPATEAVAYVRTNYCKHAIESKEQEFFVIQFDAMVKGEPVPEYVKPPLTVTNSKGTKKMIIVNGTITNQEELF